MLKDYIVVDLEMTGLNPKTDKILEIGAVKVCSKQITDIFSCIVNPECEIEERVQKLTGISSQMAAEGENLDDAVKVFLEFAQDFVWVGHNIIFDYSFMKQWAVNHKIPLTKYAADTLKIARKCLPELEKKSLDYLCEYYKIQREERHRAAEDAKATQALYEILEERFLEKEPELFCPKELQYKVKRQTKATERQKNYLKELAEYHKILLDVSVDQMSRSEASRLTDKIIHQYGKLPALVKQKNKISHP